MRSGRDTIIRLYSQTKPVTATAAMILMERGMLDLGQMVSDFLPSFACPRVCVSGIVQAAAMPLRIIDLLKMTSGLVYPNEASIPGQQTAAVFAELDRRLFTDHEMTTQEVADALAGCVLAYEPGRSWGYGTSADVLGAVVEVVTGMSFADFLQKELFMPLGMADTAFWVPADKQERLASVYETVVGTDGKPSLKRYEGNHLGIHNDMAKVPAFASGGTGLASTLEDYMKFARMLLREGEDNGVRILKPQTVYLAKLGEYGWDGWLGAYFANFPGENMTILMGTQKKDAGTFALTRKLRNVILSTI